MKESEVEREGGGGTDSHSHSQEELLGCSCPACSSSTLGT